MTPTIIARSGLMRQEKSAAYPQVVLRQSTASAATPAAGYWHPDVGRRQRRSNHELPARVQAKRFGITGPHLPSAAVAQ